MSNNLTEGSLKGAEATLRILADDEELSETEASVLRRASNVVRNNT